MTIKTDDVWYGGQCEARIGVMADQDTDPTTWHYLEYGKLTVTPQQDIVDRNLIGRQAENALDPQKGRNGLFRLSGSLVIDADSRGLARVLACGLGAPTTTAADTLHTHVWKSGRPNEVYFAIQVKVGTAKWCIYRGLTLTTMSLDGKGDQAANYDVTIGFKGMTRDEQAAAIGEAPAAIYEQSYAKRMQLLFDGTAVDNVLSASWSWDRAIAEGLYVAAAMNIRDFRPENGSKHGGQAQFRAICSDFEALEKAGTFVDVKLQFVGMATGHDIFFQNPVALIQPSELSINGPGAIERTWAWEGKQDATHPASTITITNDIESYA